MRFLALAFFLFGSSAAHAQWSQFVQGGSTASSFTGVIDVETTVNHFFGLVGGSRSLASSGVKAADLCDSAVTCAVGANSCIGVKVLSTGALDLAGNYCGVGAAASVTTWCSGTATCVSGGTARVIALYDQLNQTTTATAAYGAAPDFILSGAASKPTWGCVSARSTQLNATITGIIGAQSFGATFERNANFTTYQAYITDNGSTFALFGPNTANETNGNFFSVGASMVGSATDGSGTSDFSHFHAALMIAPASAGGASQYIDGSAAGTATTSGTNTTNTTFSLCGYSGNYADAFMTRAWTDPTQVGATTAQSVTNLTTVPLP